jgi:hypothetical protein
LKACLAIAVWKCCGSIVPLGCEAAIDPCHFRVSSG